MKIKLILKPQRRFSSKKHNIFTETFYITLSTNNDKRRKSIHLMETFACGSNKKIICKK